RAYVAFVLSLAVVVTSTGASSGNGAPVIEAAEPSQSSTGAVPAREPYRSRHKGGVDLSTGVYTREDDDLVLDTPIRVVLRRSFLSGDHVSRAFGVGAMHPGEWWLYGDNDPRIPWADLILANGSRIHFTRTSPGNTQADAVLRHDSTPTEFNAALL